MTKMVTEKTFDKRWHKEVGDGDTNPNSIMDEVDAEIRRVSIDPTIKPKGSFTTVQYAKSRGISVRTAQSWFKALVDAGKAVRHGQGNRVFYTLVRE